MKQVHLAICCAILALLMAAVNAGPLGTGQDTTHHTEATNQDSRPGSVEAVEYPEEPPQEAAPSAPARTETPAPQPACEPPATAIPIGSAKVDIKTDKVNIYTPIKEKTVETKTEYRTRWQTKYVTVSGLTKAQVAAELVKGLKPYATSAEIAAAKTMILDSINQLPNKGDLESAKQEILNGISGLAKEETLKDVQNDIKHLHNYDWLWSLWNALLMIITGLLWLLVIALAGGALLWVISRIFGWTWPPKPKPTPKPEPELPVEVVIHEPAEPDMVNAAGGELFGHEQEPSVVPINFNGVAARVVKAIYLPGDKDWAYMVPGKPIPPRVMEALQNIKIGALIPFKVDINNLDSFDMPTDYIKFSDKLVSRFPHIVESASIAVGKKKLRNLSREEREELCSGQNIWLKRYIDTVPVGKAINFIYTVRVIGKPMGDGEIAYETRGIHEEPSETIEPEFKWADICAAEKAEAEAERKRKEADELAKNQEARYALIAKVRQELKLTDNEQENVRLADLSDFSEEKVRHILCTWEQERKDAQNAPVKSNNGGGGGRTDDQHRQNHEGETHTAMVKRVVKDVMGRDLRLPDDLFNHLRNMDENDVRRNIQAYNTARNPLIAQLKAVKPTLGPTDWQAINDLATKVALGVMTPEEAKTELHGANPATEVPPEPVTGAEPNEAAVEGLLEGLGATAKADADDEEED